MKELIDKAAVVAELERRIKEGEAVIEDVPSSAIMGLIQAYKNILSFLDTLDVKEVDLEKEIHSWVEDNTCRGYCSASIRDTAEHFFELGMQVSNKMQKGE